MLRRPQTFAVDRDVTLGVALVTDLLVTAGYIAAGTLLWRKAHASSARRAGAMFALWWYGNAATGVASVAFNLLAHDHTTPLAVLDAVEQLTLVFFAAGLTGFTSYVAYIYLGSHRAEWIIVPAYSLLVLWSLTNVLLTPAIRVEVVGWHPHVGRDGAGFGPPLTLMAMLLIVPLIGSIVAYVSLYRSIRDHEGRYRITLVSGALIMWLVSVLAVSVPATADSDAVQFAGRAAIIASCGLIVLAYRPTVRVRAWLGEDDARAQLARKLSQLQARATELL